MKKLIKKAMADADVNSNAELSRRSGVSPQTIADVMSGKNTTIKTVQSLLNCMGYELTYKKIEG